MDDVALKLRSSVKVFKKVVIGDPLIGACKSVLAFD